MTGPILGIHHVTAIGGPPRPNVDFYTRILGLRMIKQTVNYDDPATWHLYYANRLGVPGTVMTFFPHPHARAGQRGSGEVGQTRFLVPTGALDGWQARLEAQGVAAQATHARGRRMLELHDADRLHIALIEDTPPAGVEPWIGGGVTEAAAIRGFDSVRLDVADVDTTATFLRDVFDLREVGEPDGDGGDEGGDGGGAPASRWLSAGGDGPGQYVEVAHSDGPRSRFGAGSVHHVAFRVPDDNAQLAMRQRLLDAGMNVTDVQDRQYFHSIYFREPGGVIFEIATDGPGFIIDESEQELGTALRLPPWYEPHRDQIERALPPLTSKPSEPGP